MNEEHRELPPDTSGPTRRLLGVVALGVILGSGISILYHVRLMRTDSSQNQTLSFENVAAAASPSDLFNLDNLRLKKGDIRSGGPGKDGIPSITDPHTVPVQQARHPKDHDRVVGVVMEHQARAYPISLLNWHECINDKLGETPVAVVYCPLCDSVTVVDRRLNGKTYEFGISGLLANSNVLLYDRTDQALWSQVKLTAVSGPNAGKSLKHLPFELTTFGQWRKQYPESDVLTFKTDYQRNYRSNPYSSYFENDRLMFPVSTMDDRLAPKVQVIGVQAGGIVRAYAVPDIAKEPEGRLTDELAKDKVVVLEARPEDQRIRVVALPEGARAVHTFWFAWAAFHPQTELYGSDEPPRPTVPDISRRAPRSGS